MYKKNIKKILCIVGAISLLSVNMAYADTELSYPDCVLYDYKTGEETVIPVDEFMLSDNARMDNAGEMISPAHNVGTTKSVIEPDDRVKVDPNTEPYCKILCLNLGRDTNGDGISDSWNLGTGFMVYKDLMLTAGHCMYNSTGYVKEMRIYVKQSGSSLNSTYYYPASWVMSQAYIDNPNDANYDWCVVKLQNELGPQTGWFGYGVANSEKAVTVSGYPDNPNDANYDWCVVKLQNELGPQTGWFGYGVANSEKAVTVSGYPDNAEHRFNQYAASGTMTVSSDTRVSHNCDTEGGESGAPIYDSNYIAWGIHTHGGNSGVRINSYLYNLIESQK